MSQVEKSIEVDVPLRTAYTQWTRFETFPHFMEGVERVTRVNDTLTHWKTRVAGVEREFDAEITEQIPDERVAWTTVGGEAKWAGLVTFDHLDDVKSKVTLRLDYEPTGFSETLGDRLGFVRRRVTGDLKSFKQYIESPDVESGA
ncbi:SRPBCC family protein [Streptomyces sp. NPDC087843]|uniref:SRPBCC family protein n=1 Tax=Streptomyces sp. NPDC087843 TaxID=3365804 RepID=UPI0038009032